MKRTFFITKVLSGIIALCLFSTAGATGALTFTPLTATTLSVPSNDTAIVQYQVTNTSTKIQKFAMETIPGVTQLTTGLGVCGHPFILRSGASCTLSLQVNGSQLTQPIVDGPIVCKKCLKRQCYSPSPENILHITEAPPITEATITVTGSPLTLTSNGPTGTLTVNNTSLIVTATNVTSNVTNTALDGNVTETGNTCSSVPPLGSCTLTYTPGSTAVSQTDFPIQGSNTNAATAAIKIDAGVTLSSVSSSSGTASGGTGVTLTGIGLTGTTGVTFGGTPATSVNVVNSTTVTAVTPTHAAGAVDVVITTPSGSATKTEGYTYLTTAIGQSAYGGAIACLNGGLNNLVAATVDNSTGILWGGIDTVTTATSNTDGAANTATIVTTLGTNGGLPYAAQLCSNYEVDSQGNTPCQAGNACYNDWFLPAGNNLTVSGQLNCLWINRVAIGGFGNFLYWSSTDLATIPAWFQSFGIGGQQSVDNKNSPNRVRCVRSFTP